MQQFETSERGLSETVSGVDLLLSAREGQVLLDQVDRYRYHHLSGPGGWGSEVRGSAL